MKKILLYFTCFILICFVLPAVCTSQAKKADGSAIDNISEEKQNETQSNENVNIDDINNETTNYEYSKYGTIKLLHQSTGEVEELNIDEYLYGVLSAEMPASYEMEALKAQAIVARTYLIYNIQNNSNKHENADICDSYACCQAWISKDDRFEKWAEEEKESNWTKITTAVNDTKGKIITYNGDTINAFFHSNSGGTTESSVNIWGGIDYPYLQSVQTSGEDGYDQYSSTVTISNNDLLNKLKEKYPDVSIEFTQEDSIKILEYTESGRVRTIKFGNIEIAGTEVRTILGLKSTNFEITRDTENVTFSVTGYGHGVGMSQTGADSMAKQGSDYEEIIKHFYTGVEISYIK